MTIHKLALMLVCLARVTLGPKEAPKDAKGTTRFSKDLPDVPGKEGLMLTVEYPPGSSDLHNADAFVYVLEGSIVMHVRGGKEMTLTPGQTFYEGPSDVHVVGRNASQTKPLAERQKSLRGVNNECIF
jgi:quercetin dioxygenase-like cupin family protein